MNIQWTLIATVAIGGFAACGGSQPNGGAPAPTADAGSTAPVDAGGAVTDASAPPVDAAPDADHGAPSTTYPAFHPEVAQIQNNGGPVLTDPVIVTVTWPGATAADTDPNVDQLEAFGDAIGSSAYFGSITSEYGVHAGVSGAANHLRILGAAPATLSDQTVDSLVATSAGDPATSGWPAPTPNTVYVLYINPATTFSLQGEEICGQGVGGYHSDTFAVTGGMTTTTDVAYAIVPRCMFDTTTSAYDTTTESASHEIVEAATDPYGGNVGYGWVGFDQAHLAWDLFQQFQDEIGDACEMYADSFYKAATPFAYQLQRQWSNASAAAGHNPCVPAPTTPYFNTTPLDVENVTANLSRLMASPNALTQGYKVLAGTSKTFAIGFYSDGDTGGPWTISVDESNPITTKMPAHRLTATLDRTTGQNGEKAYVTVDVTTASTTLEAEFITVVSTLNGVSHYMPILISSDADAPDDGGIYTPPDAGSD